MVGKKAKLIMSITISLS